MAFVWRVQEGNSVNLPAAATLTAFIAFVVFLTCVRYLRPPSGQKSSNSTKTNGAEVRRSTRERVKVERWSPERSRTPRSKDSPSVRKSTRGSVTQGMEKAVTAAEEALASPVSAIKQSRLAKSLGATATSPSPPKTRARNIPRQAQ